MAKNGSKNAPQGPLPDKLARFEADEAQAAQEDAAAEEQTHGEKPSDDHPQGHQQPQDGQAAGAAEGGNAGEAAAARGEAGQSAVAFATGITVPPPHAWEWNHALELAFAGAETTDLPLGWGDIPEVMADFARVHPDAPDEAVLMQVRIARKVILLPNEDQRRVALAVKLFRTTLLAWDDILRQDAEALAAAARAANPPPVRPIPREDQAFAVEEGPMDELSDLGRAAQAQVRAQSQAQKA